MPFTTEEFFEVFRLYNDGVWPAQFLLYALGIAGFATSFAHEPLRTSGTLGILALLWLWMGGAYHLVYFTTINPAAYFFGGLCIVGGLVFGWRAFRHRAAPDETISGASWALGLALIVYGVLVYPLVGLALGHRYPAAPGFGLPCPTTIYTIGLLTLLPGAGRRALLVVPVLWAAIGSTAAFALSVPEDYGLAIAALWGAYLLAARRPVARVAT